MKILFNNEVKNATITSLTPNSNYSAPNLASQFLRLKYKSLGISDTITVQFPDEVSASGFFYGYSNAVSMTVKLYSSASVLLETLAVDCTHSSGSAFFTQRNNVRWITIEATSIATEDLYIGGIAFGVAYTMPDPLATMVRKLSNLSGSSTSGEGQVSNRYIEPLAVYDVSFAEEDKIVYYDVVDLFREVGTGHIWVDLTENNHAEHKPLYCTSNMIENPTKDRKVSFKITLTEAR